MIKTLLAVVLLGAQQPGAMLEGIVVRAGSNEPLAGAQVTLAAAPASSAATLAGPLVATGGGSASSPALLDIVTTNTPAAIPAITTEQDGRFTFRSLEPGLYRLQVLRNGYARQSYGQRIPGGPAAAIRLAAGESKQILMALIPAGNLSGTIRGADGQPQAGVPIQLLRATYNATGQRAFQVEGTARTNDRGEYRLYWITPGYYFISAGSPPGPGRSVNPNAGASSPNEVPGQSYALTFYPGVGDARAAGLIQVDPGAELSGVDFSVSRQQLYRVRGRVLDSSTGQPPSKVGLSLAYRTLAGASGAFNAGERYDPRTGVFELRNVAPGSYVVQAVGSEAGAIPEGDTVVRIGAIVSRPNARVPIEVAHADVDGITLALTSGFSIQGRLTLDGMALSSIAGWERLRVPLKPTLDGAFAPDLQPAPPVAQAPRADGTFTIDGVSPGEFRVGPVTGLPAGLYVREARFNQVDVLGQPLRLSGPAGSALEIVLSSRTGQLDGIAVNAQSMPMAGAQVVLVPDKQRSRTDLYKVTTSDASGRFLFRGVPPGDYRVYGWEALESYAYFDQDLLRRAEARSVAVRIAESSGSSITLGVISVR
jgi:hypothetical protein